MHGRKVCCAGLLSFPILLGYLLMAQAMPVQCRGPSSAVRSPDGQHTLLWKASACALWITDARGSHRQLLLRPIEAPSIGWSPDSRAFFVNDHISSDFESSYVFSIATIPQKLDLHAAVRHYLEPNERRGNAHVYAHALSWIDNEHILLRVSGHSDRPPAREFVNCYIADTHGGVAVAENNDCR